MPELPEVQAHVERLSEQFSGAVLKKFVPFNFTALKTATPQPDDAYGSPLLGVGRRALKRRKRSASQGAPDAVLNELVEQVDAVITGSGD